MEQKKIHPLIPEAQELLRNGAISRRDFLRVSTLLGMSLASAKFLAACAQAPTETQPPAVTTAPPTNIPAVVATEAPTEAPTAAPVSAIIRGGTLKAATRVERVDHPARFSLVSLIPGVMCLIT